jgi:hypothetical protein
MDDGENFTTFDRPAGCRSHVFQHGFDSLVFRRVVVVRRVIGGRWLRYLGSQLVDELERA